MTQKEAAAALGVGHRTIGDWLGGKIKWSYPAQYALECLVKYGVKTK
jgi:DNA-binding transcriptional regulator YiaG